MQMPLDAQSQPPVLGVRGQPQRPVHGGRLGHGVSAAAATRAWPGNIVIRRSQIRYLRPVRYAEIVARGVAARRRRARRYFFELLRSKGRSKIDVSAEIADAEGPLVDVQRLVRRAGLSTPSKLARFADGLPKWQSELAAHKRLLPVWRLPFWRSHCDAASSQFRSQMFNDLRLHRRRHACHTARPLLFAFRRQPTYAESDRGRSAVRLLIRTSLDPMRAFRRGGTPMAQALTRNRLRELIPGNWGDFDSLVDQFFGPGARGVQAFYVPASVWEDEGSYHVELDVPGVTRDHVELTYEKGTLRITTERPAPEETRNGPGRRAALRQGHPHGDAARVDRPRVDRGRADQRRPARHGVEEARGPAEADRDQELIATIQSKPRLAAGRAKRLGLRRRGTSRASAVELGRV